MKLEVPRLRLSSQLNWPPRESRAVITGSSNLQPGVSAPEVHADLLGLPPESLEAAVLGSAIRAAVGAADFGFLEEGAAAMVRI